MFFLNMYTLTDTDKCSCQIDIFYIHKCVSKLCHLGLSTGLYSCISALSTTIALIIYAVEISLDTSIESHNFGTGYRLGWGGTAFFFAASFCMSLDEIVRESAQNKCCRYICFRSRSDEDDNSHPV